VAEEVDLHGFVGNPHPFLRAADLFVLSSRWEGLPTALIEAVALTGRIVATDSPGGTREILEDAAVGTLVPVGDPGLLAAAMVAALERPAAAHPEALGRYAPASVRRTVLGLLGLPLNPS
jgi:glycosyltransferase involved in cell wall biosynthesis